jgi:arylsulfatase A-like enzyme
MFRLTGPKFPSAAERAVHPDRRPAWDAIGLGGSRHLKTPHTDRLGQEGVFFKNTFCTTSLCSPSRASILSGLYAHAHGV